MNVRLLVAAATAVLISGCYQLVRCEVDGDCADAGGVCRNGVCVVNTGDAAVETDGGSDSGADAGVDAGRDAGTDAGPDAGFDAGQPFCVMPSRCAAWQICVPSVDGGVCENAQFEVVSPGVGLVVGRDASVVLQVRALDGGALPSIVPYSSSESVKSSLLADAGYRVVYPVQYASELDGGVEITFGWDGGQLTRAWFTVDVEAPRLQFELAGGLTEKKRDAYLPFVVWANEAFDASVTLSGVPMNSGGGCEVFDAGPFQRCFALDFARPTLNAMDGGFVIEVSGADQVGNEARADASVGVTRVRWVASLSSGQSVQSLAIGPSGDVLAGTSTNNGLGRLFRLGFVTGATTSVVDAGDVVSIAVAGSMTSSMLFTSSNSPAGVVAARDPVSLTTSGGECTNAAGRSFSAVALVASASASASAFGTINRPSAGNGRLCLFDNGTWTSLPANNDVIPANNDVIDSPTIPTAVSSPANIVVREKTAFLVRRSGGSWLQTIDLASSVPSVSQTAIQLGSSQEVLTGLAAVDGGTVMGGTSGFAYLVRTDGGVVSQISTSGPRGIPAIASETEGYMGDGAQIVRFDPRDLSATTPAFAVTVSGDDFVLSPVIGARASGSSANWVYALSTQGRFVAAERTDAGTKWAHVIEQGPVEVHANPTLDCNRSAPDSGTGLLYVGSTTGSVHAIIVDSPGLLDTPDSWPKYQRSAGNAGNDDRTNFPTNWPCP